MVTTDTYTFDPGWGALMAPLQKHLANQNGKIPSPLLLLQEVGCMQLAGAAVPDRKQEDWKYTPLREIFHMAFSSPSGHNAPAPAVVQDIDTLEATRLVFVNGKFLPDFSDPLPAGVWIGALRDVSHADTVSPVTAISNALREVRMTPFEALTTAVAGAYGILIDITAAATVDRPLHCIYIHAAGQESAPVHVHPYKIVRLGKSATAALVETFISDSQDLSYFNSPVTHVAIGPGAHLRHYRLQKESAAGYHIAATRVFQERDSEYTSVAADLGGKLARNNIEVIHQGTGIASHLYGVFSGKGRQHLDTQSFIDHAHPHCVSNELYKGLLTDYARGVFNGKILVRQDAQKTNAFQQNSTMLLSDTAIMDSKPQLEIFADDVKCSHGATIGQLNDDAIFYLRSRGLTHAQASVLLQQAFIGEVIDKCPDASVQSYLNHHLKSDA
jgi:Fe-S cluster assembly protein SufD